MKDKRYYAQVVASFLKDPRFYAHVVATAIAILVTGLIHYKVHDLTEIDTFWGAIGVAFSFWPGMILGYLAMAIERIGGKEEPTPPAAAAICALLWFVYLFRALTLLIGLPVLSNWTAVPVSLIVKFFEIFV